MKQSERARIFNRFAKQKRGNKQLLFSLLKGENQKILAFAVDEMKNRQGDVYFSVDAFDDSVIQSLKMLFPFNDGIENLFASQAVVSLFRQICLDLSHFTSLEAWEEKEVKRQKIYIYGDPDYPKQLEAYSNSPLILYTSGEAAGICWKHPLAITIVGSRKPTSYGLAVTEDIVKACTQYGLPVISGMAQGIDRQAHEISLRLNHLTLAVLGNGIDICYPKQNYPIYQELFASGLIVSEFPYGTVARREFFPARNRILSGLAHAVVVVEAAQKSGSLITVHHALEQGKEIYAVPGNVYARTSEGTNQLIQDGAHIYTDADQFIYSLEDKLVKYGIKSLPANQDKAVAAPSITFTQEEKRLVQALIQAPAGAQELFQKLNMSLTILLETITLLESKGVIQSKLGLYDLTSYGQHCYRN